MSIELTDTTAAQVDAALVEARRTGGAPTTGQVLTLLVITDEPESAGEDDETVAAAARTAGEHPSRIIVIRRHPSGAGGTPTRMDATLSFGVDRGPGELITLDLYGELAGNAGSTVLPLLVPDTPVVAYWPADAPEDPGGDSLGRLASRRITDVSRSADPLRELSLRARHYRPGDTDLAWPRLTRWRSLVAAALDESNDPVTGGSVSGASDNPSVDLMAGWLSARLTRDIRRSDSRGPGVTGVRLSTAAGQITVSRDDGRLATVQAPGRPQRSVALPQRGLDELIAEELRRLDPDEIYAEALAAVAATTTSGTSSE